MENEQTTEQMIEPEPSEKKLKKMIKLIFTVGREAMSLEIKNKIIFYRDRKFLQGIQFMPKEDTFEKTVIMSRNRIPKEVVELIRHANSGKNLKEYNEAEDDEALVVIVKRDAALKGCVFQKRVDE